MITDADGNPYRQDPPNVIQIEPSEGCTLACRFCSIRALTKGPNTTFKFMDIETAAAVGEQVVQAQWNPRIEFAMHGEPTAHPNLPGLVSVLRSYLPQNYFLLTTNGMPLIEGGQEAFEQRVEALYAAGINTIALDAYRGLKVHEFARKMRRPWLKMGDYPKDGSDFNPHPRRSVRGPRMFIIVEDISYSTSGTHAHLSNQGGTSGPKDPGYYGKPCAKTFRELGVRWDGHVALCCDDWRGNFKVGNVASRTLEEMWHDPAMYAARKKLVRGQRDFGACDGCNHMSVRVGLLPDRKGQRTLPEADAHDLDLIEAAMVGQPYTPGVPRVWETGQGRPQPGNIGGKAVMVGPDGKEVEK